MRKTHWVGMIGAIGLGIAAFAISERIPPPPPPEQAVAEAPDRSAMLSSFASVVERVANSVVSVHTSKMVRVPKSLRDFFGPKSNGGGSQQGLGSGVIVTSDGYILTNNHVTEGADEIYVTFGAERTQYAAKKVGADPGTDLALLKIEAKDLPVIPFADSTKARVGDVVLAVGNPFGLTQTVTMGIISGLGRGGMGIVDYENFIQTDASVNPGNSGGALVDSEGRLLGINTAIFSRTGGNQGIGFAVPADLALQVFNHIREKGRVIRGYLGAIVQPVGREIGEVFALPKPSGALVADITPDSPAEKAGIQSGDVIVEMNGKKVDAPRDLRLFVGSLAPGSKISLMAFRNGAKRSFEVVLAELSPRESKLAKDEAEETTPLPPASPSTFASRLRLVDLSEEIRSLLEAPPTLEGAVISDIDPDSAAYRAGLRQGFVLTEINRKLVKNVSDVATVVASLQSRQPVVLRVWSGGQNHYFTIPVR